ncbi:hypothetical protein [Arthrobacter sp. SLBN-112]|uniref:hypothetical protein n=1 Tax=Arthrobacter sp. SLBN-112 TaxID=2768452 RepID=UPI0027AF05DC|nr:hypothetical protein [Arthrobacter sp. SLBN-112]MDQ0799510.1 beta-glucosidase/6-phospho-beta-glucosidase/beta-galactosidase [Arthrobacter sp. SLBN-112]
MILALPTYPLSPDPSDVLAAMHTAHDSYAFGDIHCPGEYPGYLLRYFRDNGIDLDITLESAAGLAALMVPVIGE